MQSPYFKEWSHNGKSEGLGRRDGKSMAICMEAPALLAPLCHIPACPAALPVSPLSPAAAVPFPPHPLTWLFPQFLHTFLVFSIYLNISSSDVSALYLGK